MNLDIIRKIDKIHPYPAKFTVDLAIKYINDYSKKGDTIYDPFLGSGTTLLASNILERNSIGTDINFIAILISQFKVLKLSQKNLNNLTKFINDFKKNYIDEIKNINCFSYHSIEHWFCNDAIRVLSLIKTKINSLKNKKEIIFSKLIMSSIVNIVSNQESDTRYAAINKPKLNVKYIAEIFIKKFDNALKVFQKFKFELKKCKCKSYLLDSKKCLDVIKPKSVDLILTSPPYPNTYDYYLYHKHRMNWLDFNVNYSMHHEIGSRREFSSLKKPKKKFNDDMTEILNSCNCVLKKGGYIILVMGDGKINGKIYKAKPNMISICKKLNWTLIDYTFSYLDDTSKSFQQSYRTKGKKEHIMIFKKV